MKQYVLDYETKIYAISVVWDDEMANDDIKILKIFETKEEYESYQRAVDDLQQFTGHTGRLLYKK